MAELREAGYENLRDHMEGESRPWRYLELQEADGTKIVRRAIDGGTGAYIEPRENGGQTVVYRMVVIGSDDDMPTLPVIAHQTAIKDEDTDSATPLSVEELEVDFHFLNVDCQLTVYHKIEVPKWI